MTKFAVIQTAGKQYRVTEGMILKLDKVVGTTGETITFDQVLLTADNDTVVVGKPTIANATVQGIITEVGKGEKIRIVKYKPKSRYTRVTGHRQALSKIKITKI